MNAFASLRAADAPSDPDRRFVDRLRAEIVAALAPTIDLNERNDPMSTTTVTTPVTTASTATASALVPYLAVRSAVDAIAWYGTVFGARELVRYTGDDGRIGHAELAIGTTRLYLADEYPDYGAVSPTTLGGTTVALSLTVPDVDDVFTRAVAGGATVQREPADQPYGDRSCAFFDPWGQRWIVQTSVASPTTAEIDAAMDGFTVTDGD